MQKFKKLIFLYILANTTIGCIQSTINSGSIQEQSSALFIVNEVKGNLNIAEQTVLPKTFTINLQACIQSRIRNQALPLTDYAITHNMKNFKNYQKSKKSFKDIPASSNLKTLTGKEIIRLKTDGNSCLNWTEEFTYSYYNQSQWIQIDRYIQGLSTGWPGIIRIPIAINPWLQLSSQYKHLQVVDYRKKYGYHDDATLKDKVTQDGFAFLKQIQKREQAKKVPIIIDQLEFFPQESKSKGKAHIVKANIKANIYYAVKDILGGQKYNQINTGYFSMHTAILVKTTKPSEKTEHYFILNKTGASKKISTRFENDALVSGMFTWELPNETTTLPISLYIKIIPQGTSASRVKTFEGIYYISTDFGEFGKPQLKLSLNSELKNKYLKKVNTYHSDSSLPNTKVTKHINTTDQCLKNLSNQQSILQYCISKNKPNNTWNQIIKGGWQVAPLEISFYGVKNENWLSRTTNTLLRTTIKDLIRTKNIPNQDIKIATTDLSTGMVEEKLKRTNEQGILEFTVATKNYWYKKQRYFLKLIHFSTDNGELNVEKLVAINPWHWFVHGFEVDQATDIRTTCLKDENTEQLAQEIINNNEIKNLTVLQKKLLQNFTCHIIKKSTKKDSNLPKSKEPNWTYLFNSLKNTLPDILRINDTNSKPYEATVKWLNKKFTNIENTPAPRMYIHLFRDISKYPTLLVDSSLYRSLFYNVRIKLTPRIVRMDSLHLGQQDKGPLRDGIYILQLALLKNNQERVNGKSESAIPLGKHEFVTSGKLADTSKVYSCLNTKKDSPCITKEDFIVPPVNIPILVRDGIIRSDIHIPISRENLLFTNSKNLLVFKIVLADPKSIVCKDGSTGEKCASNKKFDMGYDWEKTLTHIRKANKTHYDLISYTYQTPFIPSAWNNWIINKETDINFSDLENIYEELTQASYLAQNHIEQTEKINDNFNKESSFMLDNRSIETSSTPMLKPLMKDEKNLVETFTLDSNTKNDTNIFDSLKDINKETSKTITGLQSCPSISVGNKKHFIKNNPCKCPSLILGHTPNESIACMKERKAQVNQDLSDKHIAYFTKSNALCFVPIQSSTSVNTCGTFSSSQELEKDFIQNLNRQISFLNGAIKEAHTLYPTNKWKEPHKLNKSLIGDHQFSSAFRSKLSQMPELPFLNTNTLKQVVQSDISKNEMNLHQLAFIHAICGFWFEKFYTNKYTNTELLKSALKKVIRNTFYYKIKGFNPYDDSEDNTHINTAMEKLQTNYSTYLNGMHIRGFIDDTHNWVNNTKGYGFDSKFNQTIEQRLNATIRKNPFSHTPSWEEGSHKDFHLSYYLNEAIKTNNYGLNGVRRQPMDEDRHPVRKCINNPSHFFGFEKRIISGQIGNTIQYEKGEPHKLSVSEEFMMNTQRDQGANQDSAVGIGSNMNLFMVPFLFAAGAYGFFAKGLSSTLGRVFAVVSSPRTTVKATQNVRNAMKAMGVTALLSIPSASWSYKSYEGTGKRRVLSYRITKNIELIVDHSQITIPLNKSHECLVIRPRWSAFEPYRDRYDHIWKNKNKVIRSMYESIGMLLCTEGEAGKSITEDYYYIYPNYPVNSITMDTSSSRNKPFTISLRGKNEYNKFVSDLSCWLTKSKKHLEENTNCRSSQVAFDYLLTKNIEFVDQLRSGFEAPKLFHQTQISPGVYSPSVALQDRKLGEEDASFRSWLVNTMAKWSFMDMDIESFVRKSH